MLYVFQIEELSDHVAMFQIDEISAHVAMFQIEEMAMIPAKEAKELLYNMFAQNFITIAVRIN